jgi:hypothetical protein
MLSADQHREFGARGILRLAEAVESAVVDAFRERLLAFVAERKLEPEGLGMWLAVKATRTASVAKACGFAELWGPTVLAALDELLGAGRVQLPKHAGQILPLTWPQPAQTWQVPDKGWHLDYMAPGAARELPGMQVFLCLDRVESRGAATLVVAGIPRLVDAIRLRRGPRWEGRSADVRGTVIREVPWFRELCSVRAGEDRISRFLEKPTPFAGGELQVVELVGEPGDVWLMHPWMLHAPSANCSERPRMVLTERIRALQTAARNDR